MGINGVGGYGNYSNYQSTVSQIKLQHALSKNTRYTQSVEAVDRVNRVDNSSRSSSIEFLGSYSSSMSDVMSSANTLRSANRAGVMNDLTVTSSDQSVATVTERYTERAAKDISLDVTQLATAQQNVAEGAKGAEAATQNMEFAIQGSGQDIKVSVNAQRDDGTTKTNRDMINEAAKQINKSGGNVIATVGEKDGVTTLKLTAANTGTAAAFRVSGETGAAKGIETEKEVAQNAEYSVTTGKNTRSYTSQSNQITMDMGKIGANLKAVGQTQVAVAPDDEKIIQAVSDLVQSYNDTVSFLKDNQSHGVGVSKQQKKMEMSLAAPSELSRMGITTKKDGSLALDREALKKSLVEEPEITRDLLSGSSGLAQTTFNRAASAARENSASLISADLQEMNEAALSDPINFMSMYSKSGAQNMNNYMALGMMMNYLA